MRFSLRSGISRREIVRIGSLAFGGLTTPALLRANSKDISCIVLFQNGGCCQLSSWDPKPDAPSDIRGRFKSIPSAIAGIRVGEHFERTAKLLDKLTIIRSMTSDVAIHDVARRYVASGTRPRNEILQPSFAAVAAKEFGSANGLPASVVIPGRQDYAEAGFLGPAFDPFVAGDPRDKDYKIKDVALTDGVTFEEALANKRLLESLDRRFQIAAKSPAIDAMDQFYQKAFDLISSSATREAFNIHAEPDKLRDRYGRTTIGQGALLARRLIEAGVRLVTVDHGGYDTHTGHEPQYEKILPDYDRALSALIADLDERGRLDTTLVLAIGEFGRTPKLNPGGGRDHWPNVFSAAMCGAGLKRGFVLGASDATASAVKDRPVKIEDLAATVYKLLGIDHHKMYEGPNRPVTIVKDGEPVKELFA